jgi:N6-adenosine-specific RNA methylase IME4
MKRNEASAETRAEKKAGDEQRISSIVPAVGKFRTLVIDPPWDYEWLSIAGRAAPGYATMTHDELLSLDVAAWVDAEFCHLYLWTTNNFLTRAVDLMQQWGFQHKTVLTWVKPRWGLGSYFRNSTEQVLFGTTGTQNTRTGDIGTHFEAPMGEHSEKPEKFYDIVRRASFPPYGEAFQRKERDGFKNLYEPAAAA